MLETDISVSYSIACFIVIFLSGCIVNLLKQHFIFQLTGIAFFFTAGLFKTYNLFTAHPDTGLKELYFNLLPLLAGLSACLISMIIGFLVFPSIRKMFKS